MLIGAGELIKRSWKLYTDNFNLFVKFSLLALVPGLVAFVLTFGAVAGGRFFSIGNGFATYGLYILIGIALLLAIIWVGSWINFGLRRVISARYMNMPVTSVKEALMSTKPIVWRGLGTSVLAALVPALPLVVILLIYAVSSMVIMVGAVSGASMRGLGSIGIVLGVAGIAAVIFALIYSVRLVFSTYRTVLDNEKIVPSLKASSAMVKGRWWSILWRLFAPSFVFGIVLFIVSAVLSGIGQNMGGVPQVVLEVIRIAITLVYAPLPASAVIILYHEAKNTPVAAQPQTV